MKLLKQTVSVLLCVLLFCGTLSVGATALPADEQWQAYYADYVEDGSAIYMAPGADETQRGFSWYSALNAGTPRVIVSENENFTDARTYTGTFVKTPEGDRSNKVTVTDLLPGHTYYYKCVTDLGESSTATFSTVAGKDFTALYTTDIHVSRDEEEQDGQPSLVYQSYTFSAMLERASDKAELDLILSSGDQATRGYRSEYTALAAAPMMRSVPFAFCVGNHDRKGIAYKYFTINPNEYKKALVSPFISYDYCYVKGDVLFLVFDSNCGSMSDHRRFAKEAIEANPDVKWRVASFHHDLYGGRLPHREDENELLRTIWAPILDEFAIDLVLLGHSHYYTMSNAIFDNTTNQSLAGLDSVTDPKGAVVMVSGSVNHPRSSAEETEPPVGKNIAYAYLTEEPIYNLIDFTEDSITIRSYELSAEEPFHTFTITKTSAAGAHPQYKNYVKDFFIRIIADIYGFFNETVTTLKLYKNWNSFVGK
ncbi:MAG: metallophosphoesterase [Acutalibacteraceae bacterium]